MNTYFPLLLSTPSWLSICLVHLHSTAISEGAYAPVSRKKLWRSIFSQPKLEQPHQPTATKSLCKHVPIKTLIRKNFVWPPSIHSFALAGPLGIRAGGEENKCPMKERRHLGLIQTSKEMEKIFSPEQKFWTNNNNNDGNRV